MSPTTTEELTAARAAVRRMLRQGAIVAPSSSPWFQNALLEWRRVWEDREMRSCVHREHEDRLGHCFVATFNPKAFTPLCPACFESLVMPTYCVGCLRRPAPQLRTIVARHHDDAVVIVGRLCKVCRPGLIA